MPQGDYCHFVDYFCAASVKTKKDLNIGELSGTVFDSLADGHDATGIKSRLERNIADLMGSVRNTPPSPQNRQVGVGARFSL